MISPSQHDLDDRRFQVYRLTLVALWPDSELKRAVMAAIRSRLRSLP